MTTAIVQAFNPTRNRVMNCALLANARREGGVTNFNQFLVDTGASTSQVVVKETDAAVSRFAGDFDLFGMCPSS